MEGTEAKASCPRCKSSKVGRDSKKRWFDFLYSFIQQRPGRCSKCGKRFGLPFDPTVETVEYLSGPGKKVENTQSPGRDHDKEFSLALPKKPKPDTPESQGNPGSTVGPGS